MADNTQLPVPSTSGDIIAADDIGGVKFQRVKLIHGADGVNAGDVSAANPLPITGTVLIDSVATNQASSAIAGTDNALTTHSVITGESTAGGGAYVNVKVNPSGALAVEVGDSALPTGAATSALQSTGNTTLSAIDTKLGGTLAVSAASLPLPTGAATETTLAALNAKLPTATASNPDAGATALPVVQVPQTYWDWSFARTITGGVDSTRAVLVQTGTGMAVNQTGGNLVITSGTTANSETIIRSLQTFNGAMNFNALVTLSQRIANNNFFVELVDYPFGTAPLNYTIVNATTVDVTITAHGYTAQQVGQRLDIGAITGAAGIPMEAVIASIPSVDVIRFTVAGWPSSGTGTCLLWGLNKIELNSLGALTATQYSFNTRRQGYQNAPLTATVNTTASGVILGLAVVNGIVSLADMVATSAGVWANRAAWRTNIPEPSVELYVQIRARNGTSAPATTTTFTVGFLRVEDYVAQQVELIATRQQSSANTLPISGAVTVSGTATATLAASTVRAGFIAGAGIWYDDSAVNLGSSVTFTGTSRDLTVTASATAFANAATYSQELRVSAESDVAGTLWLEVSRDNTNWRRVKSIATAAVTGGGQYAEIVHRPSWRYARVGYTNGGAAQARFSIGSVLMGA